MPVSQVLASPQRPKINHQTIGSASAGGAGC
jgi:hypothetical protein